MSSTQIYEEPDYLTAFLESLDYSLLNSGTAQPKLNKQNCLRIQIAKPSLKEQIAIANALSDVDALIASLETLITKKSAIKTATMQQLLTGKKRLPGFGGQHSTSANNSDKNKALVKGQARQEEQEPEQENKQAQSSEHKTTQALQPKKTADNAKNANGQTAARSGYKHTELGEIPEDWEVAEFGGLVNYVKGYPFKSSEYTGDGVRVIRVSDTTYDSIEEDDGAVFVSVSSVKKYNKWRLKENDLIFSTVGSKPPMYDSLVGKVIIVTATYDGSLLNQNAVLIRSKKGSGSFQKLLLNHFRMERYIDHIEIIYRGNANQASITLKNLFEYKLPLPSCEKEQIAIANVLSDMDTELDALQQRLNKTQQLKQGMMQELLTGKTRLLIPTESQKETKSEH
ncbi:MAG: restriction endonuclease subunit S [Pseudomonadales bacterium]|nr:restriction endonuclease subunit S [Pseudomonadales bacterium]